MAPLSIGTNPSAQRWTEAVCRPVVLTATFVLCLEFVGVWAGFESAAVVGLSRWLVRKTTQPFNFKRVTIMGFWYLTYMAMIFLPAFFVFADQEGPYRSRYLFAVHSVLITVPAGWLLAKWFCRFREHENERYFLRSIVGTGHRKRTKFAYWVLLIPSLMRWHFTSVPLEPFPSFFL